MRRKSHTLKNIMRKSYLSKVNRRVDAQPALLEGVTKLSLGSISKNNKMELGSRTVVSYKSIPGVSKTKVIKLIIGLFCAKSELSLLEFALLENLMSILLDDFTHPFQIKQEYTRILVTVSYLVLKYGGITDIRETELSGAFLKQEITKLGLKNVPTEKLPSLIKKYQLEIVVTTLPSPEINVPRFTKRYSGYCKGHPTPGRSGEAPLPLDLQPTEETEPHLIKQREFLFLFNCQTQLNKLSNKHKSTLLAKSS